MSAQKSSQFELSCLDTLMKEVQSQAGGNANEGKLFQTLLVKDMKE